MISDGDNFILKGGKVGPNLWGIVGRTAGSLEGFKYGDSLVQAGGNGLVWDEEQIAEYVADPKEYLRNYLDDKKAKSKMTFKLNEEDQRAAAAAYLASLNDGARSNVARRATHQASAKLADRLFYPDAFAPRALPERCSPRFSTSLQDC